MVIWLINLKYDLNVHHTEDVFEIIHFFVINLFISERVAETNPMISDRFI